MTAPTAEDQAAAKAKAEAEAKAKAKAGEKKLSPGQLVAFTVRDKLLGTEIRAAGVVVTAEEGEDVVLRPLASEAVTAAVDDVDPIVPPDTDEG